MEYLVIPASVTHIISRGIIDDDEYSPLDLKVYINLTAAPATWEDMWAFDIAKSIIYKLEYMLTEIQS